MGSVVSDSSTLMHLAAIGRLGLLEDFYGVLAIPPAVWREVVIEGKGRAGAGEVEKARDEGWVQVVGPGDDALPRILKHDLDDGEAEAIALAVELKADLVLLDETDARERAEALGVRKSGAVGVLIRARLEGVIDSLRVELDRLRQDSGFWISDQLYHDCLTTVGEAEGS